MSVCSCFFVITQANKPEHLKNIETYDIIKIDNSPYTVTNGGKTYTYTYNDEGLRTSKTVDGVTTRYYYEGSLLVAEASETETFVYLYDSTGAPIGFQYRASTYAEDVWDNYYYEKNLQGDIVAIYDDNGNKILSYRYDAYGIPSSPNYETGEGSTATKNPFRYRGYYYDSDLGLYYLQSRYYDAITGRFISPDSYISTGQGILGNNMFAYCNNNPVNNVDYTGEFPWLLVGSALIGYAIYTIVLSAVFSDITEEDEFMEQVATGGGKHNTFNVLYVKGDVQTLFDKTFAVGIEAGLYDDTGAINDNTEVNIDVLKASASIGYTGISAGVYWGEISFSQEYDIFGKTATLTFKKNKGFGGEISLGKRIAFALSLGKGFGFSLEFED